MEHPEKVFGVRFISKDQTPRVLQRKCKSKHMVDTLNPHASPPIANGKRNTPTTVKKKSTPMSAAATL